MANYLIKETIRALRNLDEIADFYEKESIGLGTRFANYYYKKIDLLRTMPNLGRTGIVFGTRELVLQEFPFLLIYRVRDNYVEILRIFHQMREYPK